jgi:hypothetical protein
MKASSHPWYYEVQSQSAGKSDGAYRDGADAWLPSKLTDQTDEVLVF